MSARFGTGGLHYAAGKNMTRSHEIDLADARAQAYEDYSDGAVSYDKNWHCQE